MNMLLNMLLYFSETNIIVPGDMKKTLLYDENLNFAKHCE